MHQSPGAKFWHAKIEFVLFSDFFRVAKRKIFIKILTNRKRDYHFLILIFD